MKKEMNEHRSLGYLSLHPDAGLNFTLNRLLPTIPAEELREVASRIDSLASWIYEMRAAGEQAEQEGRLVIAARYFHAAEFYMKQGDPDKGAIYEHSVDLMNRGLPEMAKARVEVPYNSGFLPVIRVAAVGEERDVLLIHSGFDGLVEEMYPMLATFATVGYTVIAFEGPGQGAALRTWGLHMPYDWEKPVSAVLDHFNITRCTLIGMSLGGYLAPRAAAFEKRIKRVVSWGAMYDFFEVYRRRLGTPKFNVLRKLLDLRLSGIVDALITRASENEDILKWAVAHGMHVSGTTRPSDFLQWVRTLNLEDSAHLINQDVLLVMGAEDHLVAPDQLYVQAAAMTGARSIQTVMLTQHDQAAQHCQVGNIDLVVTLILGWLETLTQRDKAAV